MKIILKEGGDIIKEIKKILLRALCSLYLALIEKNTSKW